MEVTKEAASRVIYLLQWSGAQFHKAIRAIQADCPPEIAERIDKAFADNQTPADAIDPALTTAHAETAALRAEVERLRGGLKRIANHFDRDRHIIQSIARQALKAQP